MSKHRHQSKAEQIYNKTQGSEPFNYEKMPRGRSMHPEGVHMKAAVEDSSIQALAYQIYREKGGSALDNWLEAERILENNDSAVSSFTV